MGFIMEIFAWSINDDDYTSGTFSSFDDAVADALDNAEDDDCNPVESVYIGECKEYANSKFFPDGWDIVNHMLNAANDVVGEHADDYPDVDREAIDELTKRLHKLLEEWCTKHGVEPSFYEIESSKLVKIR